MICEIRENGNEVVLHHPKVSNILAFISCLIHKDREIVFSRPQDETGENGGGL